MTKPIPNPTFYQDAFSGAWITQALAVAAELGIADRLARGPCTVEELAQITQTHAPSLYRVLRALAGVGVFSEGSERQFALTPLAECLRSDVHGSQRGMAAMMGAEFHAAWGQLLHSTRTGEPGFNHWYRMPFFQYMASRPDRHALYDAAMTGVHGPESGPLVEAYDFARHNTVADIGGGNGTTLATVLQCHPGLHGILFDLPEVANRARATLGRTGVSDRCRIVGGDFFQSVPAGADAFLLRHVIHDWQDEEAIIILGHCRAALPPCGRVLVVETVLPAGNAPSFGKWLDLMMLLVGGRERTEEEYRGLFNAAGLSLQHIAPTTAGVSVLEAVHAS